MEWSVRRVMVVSRVCLAFLIVVTIVSSAAHAVQAEAGPDATQPADDVDRLLTRSVADNETAGVRTAGAWVLDPAADPRSAGMARLMALLGTQEETQEDEDPERSAPAHREPEQEGDGDAEAPADEPDPDDAPKTTSGGLHDTLAPASRTVSDAVARIKEQTAPVQDRLTRTAARPLPMLVPDGADTGPAVPMGPPEPERQTQVATPATPSTLVLVPLMTLGILVATGAVTTAAVGGDPFVVRGLAALRRVSAAMGLAPLFSKIKKEDVLEHRVRGQVVAALRAEPGLTVQALRRRFRLGYSTLAHHVRILEQHGIVTAEREGRHRRLFLVGTTDRRALAGAALLANPATARVYEAVVERPGGSLKTIAEATGIGANTVHWHIGRLHAAGLVTKRRIGRRVAVEPASRTAILDPTATGSTIETAIPTMDQA